MYQERTYRKGMLGGRFSTVTFSVQETDVEIGYVPAVSQEALLSMARRKIVSLRNEILSCPDRRFLTSFAPIDGDGGSPILSLMLSASRMANVGPMASVAGAVAQELGKTLKEAFCLNEIVVENGGDLYIDVKETITVRMVAPGNALDGKIAFRISPSVCPIGVATSSGKMGPSVSFGTADAVMVACRDAALADAFATAFCNGIKKSSDVRIVAERAKMEHTVIGFLALCDDKMAVAGDLEVVSV
ncbi:MAG: UPF0280 family protein [Sphaerochaetaceae bacterium]|jgi:ApbE superfamily uncharacterized protein (UPF0280 family)